MLCVQSTRGLLVGPVFLKKLQIKCRENAGAGCFELKKLSFRRVINERRRESRLRGAKLSFLTQVPISFLSGRFRGFGSVRKNSFPGSHSKSQKIFFNLIKFMNRKLSAWREASCR